MQEAPAPKAPSLIKLGKLANAKKFDQLEELWPQAVEQAADAVDDLLAIAGQVGRLGAVERADTLAAVLIGQTDDPAAALAVARAAARQIPEGATIRTELVRLYKSVFPDFAELPGLIDAFCAPDAKLDRAVALLDAFVALRPGAFAVDFNFVVPGVVESVNPANGVISVRFHDRFNEYGPTTLGKIHPRPADYFPALILYAPDRLRELAESDAAAFVKLALKAESDQRLTYKDLKLQTTRLLGEKGWTHWWRAAREVLKHDPMLAMSAGSQPTFRMLRQADRYEDRLRRRFDRTSEPADRLRRVLDYLDETSRKDNPAHVDEELLTHFGNSAAKIAVGALTTEPVLALAALSIHAAVAARGVPVATPNPRAAQQVLARIGDAGVLATDLPDALVQPTLAYLRESLPDTWDGVFAAVLLRAGKRLADVCARTLIDGGRQETLRESLVTALAKPTASPDLINWLWRARAGSGPLARTLTEFSELTPYAILVALLTMAESIGHLHAVSGEERHLKVLESSRSDLMVEKGEPLLAVIRSATAAEASRLRDLSVANSGLQPSLRSRLKHMLRLEHPELFTEMARPWEDESVLYTTAAGLRQRQEQFHHIVDVEIPEVAKQIGEAASFGDLSENAEFTAALEKRDQLASRATTMENELKLARVISADLSGSDHVNIGTRVTARNLATGTQDMFTFLGPWDSDADRHILFYHAPLALAFMGHRVGETVVYGEGADRREWDIVSIAPAEGT